MNHFRVNKSKLSCAGWTCTDYVTHGWIKEWKKVQTKPQNLAEEGTNKTWSSMSEK